MDEQEDRLRVLLIENDAPVMRLMSWALTEDGFDVRIVSRRDALEIHDLHGPDAAVLNMSAPPADKRAYAAQLRMLYPNCVIIDVQDAGSGSAKPSSADVYLSRPLSLDALAPAIRNACAKTISEREDSRRKREPADGTAPLQ